MVLIELFKAFLIGIVEGITEWLPISSTGHMILLNEFVKLDVSEAFWDVFLVVIQLGAIMAVIILYFHKLNPFSSRKNAEEKHLTWSIWAKVVVGSIPAAIVGLLFDDWAEAHLYGPITVSIALIVYGIVFIVIEQRNRPMSKTAVSGKHSKELQEAAHIANAYAGEDGRIITGDDELDVSSVVAKVNDFSELSYTKAFLIGVFQSLAVIPGTSRSGSTIIGSMLLGTSRTIATEFAFFLAIPIMFGWSLLKIIKHGFSYTGLEYGIFIVGIITAFIVSIVAIKFLMSYIKKNDFMIFGWYRIVLGIVVIIYFGLTGYFG
ncbi:MAG: undecaprenyl-diphosphate phosphatase [Actinobacteria bacterium]|nr:undecaprenyl-diphosphate phosphatase [Actinomycetota bacterium]